MRRDTMSAFRARERAFEQKITDAVDALAAERKRELEERRAATKAAHALIPFTEEELQAAAFIRDARGIWHRVVKVNAKSVTVSTGYSWTERIPRDRIREVRP